ncbi:hypothetical protein KFK09_028331 [Dendrobium nobile]|uniref:Uncharacterized protein n=1 Tax=Dendrobium nobile TaxID=94219 RepID=A0A8T3A2U4_DENNO|nr:hypothetical protein KFK09_028331 [Dendrobium nobile]
MEHPGKEKGEEKPKYRKDKKQYLKALWVDSASDSSKTKPEEEITNLCLMADHLDSSDQEDVCKPTYDQLVKICERVHVSYKKHKKTYASLKLKFFNLKKEHESLNKDYTLFDSNHMSLLDEFDELNKKNSELIVEHDSLKASYTTLEFDFKAYTKEYEHKKHC